MRKLFLTLAAVAALAGCTNAEKGAVVGGLGGAAVGGLVTGDTAGAAVGGLIGAAGGYLIGKSADRPGYCRYRDQYGRIYEDRC
jgi:hypothetical protein